MLEFDDSAPTMYSVLPELEKRRPPNGRVTFAGRVYVATTLKWTGSAKVCAAACGT